MLTPAPKRPAVRRRRQAPMLRARAGPAYATDHTAGPTVIRAARCDARQLHAKEVKLQLLYRAHRPQSKTKRPGRSGLFGAANLVKGSTGYLDCKRSSSTLALNVPHVPGSSASTRSSELHCNRFGWLRTSAASSLSSAPPPNSTYACSTPLFMLQPPRPDTPGH